MSAAQDSKFLQERQFGIITDLFPPIPIPTSRTQPTDSASSTLSKSSTHSTSTSNSTTATSSSSTSTSSSLSISSPTTSSPSVVVTTVAGKTITWTSSAGGQTPTILSPSPATTTAFLQNKVLSGIIFGIVGLVGLTIFIAIAACVVKWRRNKKLIKEAVMFDPVSVASFNDHLESGRVEKPSSLGHERNSAEYGSRPYPTPYMYPTTAPHGGVGHFQPPSTWPTPVERHA